MLMNKKNKKMEHSELSKRVKEFRTRKGLTQELLAENAGLSLRTVQRIENGEVVPRGDTLKRLALALKVSPDEIIDWQVTEDRNVLLVLHLSQFGYLIAPFIGIIIPLVIWVQKKEKIRHVDEQGKSILNFQITWILIFFLAIGGFIAAIFMRYLPVTSAFILYAVMIGLYLYNAFLIVINTILSINRKKVYYIPALPMLR